MAHTEWSTDSLAERDRFAFWREELLAPLGIAAEPNSSPSCAFHARVTHRSKGPLTHLRVEADAHRVMRRSREIARRLRRGYSVYLENGEGTWFRYGGLEYLAEPGDLFVTNADEPWESGTLGRHRLETLLLPKSMLDPHLPALGGPFVARLSRENGPAALAADFFQSLTREWDRLDPAMLEAAADTFCRLVAVVGGAAAGDQRDAVGTARLAQARQYAARHLADPELSPARAAAGLGISLRSLHQIFEPSGTSFARYVMRRRLQECRAAMVNPAGLHRSVTDIALGWGFNSLPTFYRAFRREFGETPSEVRAEASRHGS